MARRLHLHIGVMKSATSYLQTLLDRNRARLDEHGLYWAPWDIRYDAVSHLVRRGHDTETGRILLEELVSGLRAHDGDALLSNELLAGLGDRQIAKLVRRLPAEQTRVIITARDPARIIPSHWQTAIRNGETKAWSDFAATVCADAPTATKRVANRSREGQSVDDEATQLNQWFWWRHDLPLLVDRWAAVVPREHITVVTVPADSGDITAVADRFGSAIGVDLSGLESAERARNTTLGAYSVELLRRLNGPMGQAEFDDPRHRYERALGRALSAHAQQEPRFGLSQEQQDWVAKKALEMIDGLEQREVTVVGDLTDLIPATSPPVGSVDPGATTDAELLAAAARGIVSLAPAYNSVRTRSDELRRLERVSPALLAAAAAKAKPDAAKGEADSGAQPAPKAAPRPGGAAWLRSIARRVRARLPG